MKTHVVVDASVWVSWLSPSDSNHHASSIWLDLLITQGGLLILPTFLLIEIAAAISRLTGQAIRAKEAISKLNSISAIQIIPLDDILIQVAIDVATNLQLRAGEAIYVALAHQQNIPLVTWDKEQLQKAANLIKAYTPNSYIF